MALIRAIDELPLDYRPAAILHDVDGLSTVEVAASLGITVANAKSRAHRARLFLRKRLGNLMSRNGARRGEALTREQSRPAPVDLRASRLDPHTRGVSVHAGPRPGDANGLIRLIAAAITQFGKAHAEGEAASERSRDESTSVAESFACSRGRSDGRGDRGAFCRLSRGDKSGGGTAPRSRNRVGDRE